MVLVYISLQTLLTKAKAHGRGQQQNALHSAGRNFTPHTPVIFFHFVFYIYGLFGFED
jgi:hypothetical protein